ncbi:MAG: bifunctional ornithine acetyltransferase/N-acetylglutamate synthase [Halofilum sp. (in: g-proteobacteria)]|nr:bifunctional ornithine acetyltransferase/N-acetylglutamate synthase [Halofilum sp. (in: g-proteobacteria)]
MREGRKIGRNEPCWCGSGKKFKHCHGKLVPWATGDGRPSPRLPRPSVDGVRSGRAPAAGLARRRDADAALVRPGRRWQPGRPPCFTRNAFCAAPVHVARAHLGAADARVLLINAGCANAGTGDAGRADAEATCAHVGAGRRGRARRRCCRSRPG